MPTIDPQLIALLMQQPTFDSGGNGLQRTYTDPQTGQTYIAQANYGMSGSGMDQAPDRNNLGPWYIHQQTGANSTNVFDPQGNYLGPQSGMSENTMLAMLALAAAGGAYAGGAFGGAAPAAAAPAAGSGAGSITLPTMAELGVAPATAGSLVGTLPAVSIAPGLAAGAAASGGVAGAAAKPGVGSGIGSLGSLASGQGIASLLGGVAGALQSKDQTQTQKNEPWGPAQPAIQSLLGQLTNLQQQYQQNPFSQGQKSAYNNWTSLLGNANQMAPAMFSGMGANASGLNNYDRANPRRSLVGSNAQLQWTPSLLNFFPGG